MKVKIIMTLITLLLVGFVIIVTLNSEEVESTKIEDVVFEEGKVNIYYFWGDGCPHCSAQSSFLESLKEEYGDYFNLYKFEVWSSEKNAKLMLRMAEVLEENASGVPYTIIGEKSFIGFNDTMKQDIINAIKTQRNNDFDVYKILLEQEE